MLNKIQQQLKYIQKHGISSSVSPFDAEKSEAQKMFLNKLSKHALELFEKKSDINKFTKLALSDLEKDDSIERVENMIKNHCVSDVLSDDSFYNLSNNENLLNDLNM